MSHQFFGASAGTRRDLFPGVQARIVWGTGIMLSLVELEPRAVVAEHEHPHEQMGLIIEGRAEFTVGGERRVLGPGEMYQIPGGVRHSVLALDEPVTVLDVFHPPREEYK
jgi:quercetin dioxygenase-like cupin family protein